MTYVHILNVIKTEPNQAKDRNILLRYSHQLEVKRTKGGW